MKDEPQRGHMLRNDRSPETADEFASFLQVLRHCSADLKASDDPRVASAVSGETALDSHLRSFLRPIDELLVDLFACDYSEEAAEYDNTDLRRFISALGCFAIDGPGPCGKPSLRHAAVTSTQVRLADCASERIVEIAAEDTGKGNESEVAESLHRRASHRSREEEFTRALVHFNDALACKDSDATHLLSRALAHLAVGNNASSLADSSSAINMEPRNAAFRVRAAAAAALGRFDQAIEDIQHAILLPIDLSPSTANCIDCETGVSGSPEGGVFAIEGLEFLGQRTALLADTESEFSHRFSSLLQMVTTAYPRRRFGLLPIYQRSCAASLGRFLERVRHECVVGRSEDWLLASTAVGHLGLFVVAMQRESNPDRRVVTIAEGTFNRVVDAQIMEPRVEPPTFAVSLLGTLNLLHHAGLRNFPQESDKYVADILHELYSSECPIGIGR